MSLLLSNYMEMTKYAKYRCLVTLSLSVPGFFLFVMVNPSSGLPSDSAELFPFLALRAAWPPIFRSSSLLMLSGSLWGRLEGVMLPLLRDGVIDLLALKSSLKLFWIDIN